MGLIERFKGAFEDALRKANPEASPEELDAITKELQQRIKDEPPPKIAVVGEAGVGKSSTLNALFNAGLSISHTRACTKTDIELTIDLTAPGDAWPRLLVVYDMPGLGESIQADKENLEVYRRVIPEVDAFVWVLDAQNRAIRSVQERLSEDIAAVDTGLSKLVVALNKVDLVDPGERSWNTMFNVPGEDQQANIEGREEDVRAKLQEVAPGWPGATVAYSALRRYRLSALFRSMVDAVPAERQWLLGDRMNLANYEELVDERALQAVKTMAETSDGA
jgi:predicted GTPase